jgi:[glutamine synthetase] adenylyltransferase / [glutamine synthetase]-adenylyl-L-tyrosine phosphorylase
MAAPDASGRIPQLLARLGFHDIARAQAALAEWWDAEAGRPVDDAAGAVVAALARAPDPDVAARGLADLLQAADTHTGARVREALHSSGTVRSRLLNLLGASPALAMDLAAHPQHSAVLLTDEPVSQISTRMFAAVGADVSRPITGHSGAPSSLTGSAAVTALRDAYRREVIAIAARDLSGELDLAAVTRRLSDLAAATLGAGLAVAAAMLGPDAARCRLAVIALGKTGGAELNYVSDVDVIFVAEPENAAESGVEQAALAAATRLASELMRVCGAAAWQVDAALRPEGKDGQLVRTVASHEAYYRRWAQTWEFQALLKARWIAGDAELGRRYLDAIAPLVWTAAERRDFVPDVRKMRRRVVSHVPAAIAPRELKLGPGGLRDVEFAVQLLQLVHGRADESLRMSGTLSALAALSDGGYVGRDDAVSLGDAYRFLRACEHRLQLHKMRRTHLVPDDPAEQLRLARAMGYRADSRGDARAVWQAEWALHGREVRRLHEKLFYRPLLEAVARVPTQSLRLTPAEAERRLGALGFADPKGALRHIEALTAGLSRRAALQRTLLPVILSDLADAPDPDAGLLAYRQVSERLGATHWYLRSLRDEGAVATRLAFVLGTSRYAANMLGRAPDALQMLAEDAHLVPRPPAELRIAMRDATARQQDPRDAVLVVRGMRRQELLRTAFADLLGQLDVLSVGEAISATTEATLDAALHVAVRGIEADYSVALPIDFAIIAMGRLGGSEVSYSSDADVLFVYQARDDTDPHPAADRMANEVAERLRALLGVPSTDPPLGVDANLRPEGRNGPLARSLGAYQRYYARWSSPWEAQALLRARFVAGDEELGRQFIAMIDHVRYPDGGVSPADLTEIRRLKGRVDAERLPRGADPWMHTKLGRGGLADIEWTAQLLQLAHGHEVTALRTTRTLPALEAAGSAGLLDDDEVGAMEAAWRMATAVRNAIMLVRDKAGDQLPHQGPLLVGVGRAMGYPAGFVPDQLVDDYRRTARRARRVVEKVFYGVD